ncbi:MAG: division/cell wall cluster transcriptional repressor MraZ [Actinomycetota bacterium]|nr:division/cell wall cluster transcriptional repressor MraZ [Actinomycetota bacterium]
MGYGVARIADPGWRGSSHFATPDRLDLHRNLALAFNGTFEHSLDAKNRLTVPAKFRSALAQGVYLVRRVEDKCVLVYPADKYAAIAEAAVSGLNPMSRQAREARRRLFGFADEMPLDGAGRITLGKTHLQHAGIGGRDVVIAGVGDALELWSPDGWGEYERSLMQQDSDFDDPLAAPA